MQVNVDKEVAAMQRMSTKQLRDRYAEAFGETTNANNKTWLVKRIAWRLQAQVEGDLSERARRRAAELAQDADLRLSPPKAPPGPSAAERTRVASFTSSGRVAVAGTVITRVYKGRTLEVKVLPTGFEFEGRFFKSLSAVAKAVTGQHCNGFAFFRLDKETKE